MKETTLFGLRVACYSVITGCLLLEGAILAFANFSYWARWYILVIGFFWVTTCIAAVHETIRSRPILIVLASCTLFAVSAVLMWRYSSQERTLMWFLYQHALELGVIISSLVLYFIPEKAVRRHGYSH
jgi:hypothetical protein